MTPTLFQALWSFALLMDYLCFSYWRESAAGTILLLAICLALVAPASRMVFLVLCAADLLHFVSRSPVSSNHALLRALIECAFLSTALVTRQLDLYRILLPLLRILALAVYGISFIHKLNADFLNPAVSCANVMTSEILQRLHLPDLSPRLSSLPSFATLAVEAIIPVLLLSRRTIRAGVLLAWVFHFLLALHPHPGVYSFSALILVLVSQFLPERSDQHFLAWLQSDSGKVARYFVLLLIGLVALLLGKGTSPMWSVRLGLGLWMALSIVALPLLMRQMEFERLRWRMAWPLGIFVLIFLLNGFAPYLGWQTTRVFSMFSNLRTEGDTSNHLLVPASWRLADYQAELVEILESNDPALAKFARRFESVPFFEVQRLVALARQPLQLTYRRGGVSKIYDSNTGSGVEDIPPPPWLLSKLMAFRGVRSGLAACAW